MIHLREQYWAVEVPEEGLNFIVHRPLNKYWHINCDYPATHKYTNWGRCIFYKEFGGKKKYPQVLEIVCTSKGATEDDCAIIAGLPFTDVVHGYSRTFFHDLLASKGCDLKLNYLILKRQRE
jgi:hypothetical protein